MNLETIATVVNRENNFSFDRVQIMPFSARLNQWNLSQIKIVTAALSPLISFIALAETIASLVYAIFMTIGHSLTLFQSTKLQDHVIKSWAYCRHVALMTAAPYWLYLNQSTSLAKLESELIRLNSAQIAYVIEKIFDFLGGRTQKAYEHMVEATLEVMPTILNIIEKIEGDEVNPQILAPLDSQDLMNYAGYMIEVFNEDPDFFDEVPRFQKLAFRMPIRQDHETLKRIAIHVYRHKYAIEDIVHEAAQGEVVERLEQRFVRVVDRVRDGVQARMFEVLNRQLDQIMPALMDQLRARLDMNHLNGRVNPHFHEILQANQNINLQ